MLPRNWLNHYVVIKNQWRLSWFLNFARKKIDLGSSFLFLFQEIKYHQIKTKRIKIFILGLGGQRSGWRARSFKFIIWGGKSQRAEQFSWGRGGSHYIILLFWNFSSTLLGVRKSLYRIPLFTLLAVLPVFYLLIYDKLRASVNVCIN